METLISVVKGNHDRFVGQRHPLLHEQEQVLHQYRGIAIVLKVLHVAPEFIGRYGVFVQPGLILQDVMVHHNRQFNPLRLGRGIGGDRYTRDDPGDRDDQRQRNRQDQFIYQLHLHHFLKRIVGFSLCCGQTVLYRFCRACTGFAGRRAAPRPQKRDACFHHRFTAARYPPGAEWLCSRSVCRRRNPSTSSFSTCA